MELNMKRVDFSNAELKLENRKVPYSDWKKSFKKETGKKVEDFIWETLEKINVSPLIIHSIKNRLFPPCP